MTAEPSSRPALQAALREPGAASRAVLALLRGRLTVWWCRLRGVRFEVGRNFRCYGRLVVRGPGRIRLGDDVVVRHNLRHVFLGAGAPDAEILVGDRVWLHGTSINCRESVAIGDRSLIGRADLIDHEYHDPRDLERRFAVRARPVSLGRGTWLGNDVLVLKGVRIGDHTVVGARTVVRQSLPDRVVAIGNPAQVVKQLDQD